MSVFLLTFPTSIKSDICLLLVELGSRTAASHSSFGRAGPVLRYTRVYGCCSTAAQCAGGRLFPTGSAQVADVSEQIATAEHRGRHVQAAHDIAIARVCDCIISGCRLAERDAD